MGVPSFYRWLVKKYPKIVCDARDKHQKGLQFDNLYLDMNGIIHPCFHPEDNLCPPTTFEDVFENIYEYVDGLFEIVRPQKLLFLAIDGVAPRAKMNQQRSRRFKASMDSETFEEEENKFRKQFEAEGKMVLQKEKSELSDSNIITPGTEFMFLLSEKLQCYIKKKMANDSSWEKIKVILSDANVPGEGEHKIMSFIRAQRCSEGYDPNTRHCLYGLDADLIMLALATHEVHFSILREDVLLQEERVNSVSELERSTRKLEESSGKCRGWIKQQLVDEQESASESCHSAETSGSRKLNSCNENRKEFVRRSPIMKTPFQFLNVWLLKEYLDLDMHIRDPPENVKIDLERIIDDFIFICFLTGNDFLPHMPTLEIHEGAMDLLIHVYKEEFKNLGGYLVDVHKIDDKKHGYIKLKRVEKFILSVGEYEEKIFKKRTEIREAKIRRILSKRSNSEDIDKQECGFSNLPRSLGVSDHAFRSEKPSPIVYQSGDSNEEESSTDQANLVNNTKELKQKMKDYIRSQSDTFSNGQVSDKVKLASPGFKKRYYELKFSAKFPEDMECTRKKLVEKYTEGLCWVLKYYFSGVPSWTWFYPYHYGPFASDLKGLTQVKVHFPKGQPWKPLDQLLAVLPPRSANALPEVYKKLMVDDESRIIDFFPTSFQMDVEGKRFMWQAICKLPFIQEDRLLAETRGIEKGLKDNERVRNEEGRDRLFLGRSTCLGEQIQASFNNLPTSIQNDAIKINRILSHGLNGFMHLGQESDPDVRCVFYDLPDATARKVHLLEGVTVPIKTIEEKDVVETQLWHESSGSAHQRVMVNPHNHNPGSFPNDAEHKPETNHRRAGVRWGRGRGRIDNYTLQTGKNPASKSSKGSGFAPSSAYSTCANSLNLRFERRPTISAPNNVSWNSWPNTDEGSWQNRAPGQQSQPNSSTTPGHASTAWNPIQPNSSTPPGQQSHGRGQYGPGTSFASWNTRSRDQSNYR